jgi:hypothetical protein
MLWNAEDPLFLGQIGLFTVEGVVAWLDGGPGVLRGRRPRVTAASGRP